MLPLPADTNKTAGSSYFEVTELSEATNLLPYCGKNTILFLRGHTHY